MAKDDITIVVIEGTTRPKRRSLLAARFVERIGKTIEGVNIVFVDPDDFTMPADGDDEETKDPKYTQITADAEAFFIVVPEYNHSFSGSLKRLLDSEYDTYRHKPVALAGVSSGRWGGVRAIEAILSPLRTVGLVTTSVDSHFPNIKDIFDENGNPVDDSYEKAVRKSYAELIWMANALKKARED